jgi:hypothetical protein
MLSEIKSYIALILVCLWFLFETLLLLCAFQKKFHGCDVLWASMMTRRRGCLWFFGWNPLVKIGFSSPLQSCFHNNSPQQIGFSHCRGFWDMLVEML